MTGRPVTDRQREVLAAINQLTRVNQAAPSVRELGKALGIGSPNGVAVHLHALRRKGLVAPARGGRRSGVRLLSDTCPCCGQIVNQRKDAQ